MSGWTCGCGRRNFSADFPCMVCGALSPRLIAEAQARAAAEARAIEMPAPKAPPLRKRERMVAAAVVLMAVALVAGYGITHRSQRTGTTAAAQLQARQLVDGGTTTTTTPVQALEHALVSPSHDFEVFTLAGFPTGELHVDQTDDPVQRQRLVAFHFQRGEAQSWQRPSSGDVILKSVLEFDTPDDAKQYFQRDTDGADVLGGSIVPGAVTQGAYYAGIAMQEVEFLKGTRVYDIVLGSLASRFTAASPAALADEQYRAG